MTGSTGAIGPTGPSYIRQPFANLNIAEQSIANLGAVTYSAAGAAINGLDYTDTNTFTVKTPGIYVLECVLNLAADNDPGNDFAISLNNNLINAVAPAASAANAGPIVIIRVQSYLANTTVKIINRSGHNIRLANGINAGSAGHFIFYRIADAGAVT